MLYFPQFSNIHNKKKNQTFIFFWEKYRKSPTFVLIIWLDVCFPTLQSQTGRHKEKLLGPLTHHAVKTLINISEGRKISHLKCDSPFQSFWGSFTDWPLSSRLRPLSRFQDAIFDQSCSVAEITVACRPRPPPHWRCDKMVTVKRQIMHFELTKQKKLPNGCQQVRQETKGSEPTRVPSNSFIIQSC